MKAGLALPHASREQSPAVQIEVLEANASDITYQGVFGGSDRTFQRFHKVSSSAFSGSERLRPARLVPK